MVSLNLVLFPLRHVLDGPQVMEPVGEFYKDDPYIVIQSQQDPFEVFCLEGFFLYLGQFAGVKDSVCGGFGMFGIHSGFYFCKAVHQRRYFLSEKARNVFHRVFGILYHIVQKSRYDGFVS